MTEKNIIRSLFFLIICGVAVTGWAQSSDEQQRDSLYAKGQTYLGKLDMLEHSDSIIYYLQKAIPYFQQSQHWDDYVGCLNWIASAHFNNGDFSEGREVAGKAGKIALARLGEASTEYFDALSILAVLYDVEGGYDQSIRLNRRVIALSRQYGGEESELWNVYLNLGYTYKILGDYDQALFYFHRAEAVWQDLEQYATDYDYASILFNLAECFQQKAQWGAAAAHYQQSLRLLKGIKSRSEYIDQIVMDCLNGLAAVSLGKNQRDSVLHYTWQAIQLQAQGHTLARAHLCYSLRSQWFTTQGDFAAALSNMKKAEKVVSNTFDGYDQHPEIAKIELHLANIYFEQKEYGTAMDHYQKALASNTLDLDTLTTAPQFDLTQFINPLVGLDILAGIAKTQYIRFVQQPTQVQELNKAYETHFLIAKLITAIRQEYLADGSKNALAQKVLPIYEQAIEVALAQYENSNDQSFLEAAFSFAERNKAILLYENQKENLARHTAGIPDSLLQTAADLRFELNRMKRQIAEAKQKKGEFAPASIKQWQSQYFELKETHQKLIDRFEKQYPEYYHYKFAQQSASIRDIRERLPDKQTAFLEYLVGEKSAYAFLITQDQLQAFQLGSRDTLVLLVNDLRTLITRPPNSESFGDNFRKFGTLATRLYQLLLEKPLATPDHKIDRLLIVPDDILCYLPFETLLESTPDWNHPGYSPNQLEYLVEAYAFSYHYSAALYLQPEVARTSNSKIAFLGMAPSFKKNRLMASRACDPEALYSLMCSQDEVRSIQAMMKGEIALGEQANKSLFYELAAQSNIIHLATHACIDPENPELNSIYFADDFLSNYDLSALNLNADLVVLSACNTGVGRLVKGEGIMSLTRGFFLAGSRSVLTSLWAVDDCATSAIMSGFYKNLVAGHSKDIALRQAKLSFLEQADKVNTHPYYWAAFVQLGNFEALDLANSKNHYPLTIMGIIGLLGILGFLLMRKKIYA
ncbi:MAG: hypothetical protein DHS20C18_11930 [Saprospiraceae bacterium]|nr:MAG: hypothetical protein DHS20C18_11930 [Saprospiraceae bacterium]